MDANSSVEKSLKEKYILSRLLEVYGSLLTERQKDFIDLHYNEDLSFGEIAESENISRQAVHDAIQHGKKALEKFEEHLGLVAQRNTHSSLAKSSMKLETIRAELRTITKMLDDDILFDTNPLRKKIQHLLQLIEN